MWKCPACETLNNDDICVICGEPKPVAGGTARTVPPAGKPREISAYSPEMADGLDPTPKLEYKPKESNESSNVGWIFAVVILGVIMLLIIIGANSAYATDERLNTAYHGELQEQYTDTYNLLTEQKGR